MCTNNDDSENPRHDGFVLLPDVSAIRSLLKDSRYPMPVPTWWIKSSSDFRSHFRRLVSGCLWTIQSPQRIGVFHEVRIHHERHATGEGDNQRLPLAVDEESQANGAEQNTT